MTLTLLLICAISLMCGEVYTQECTECEFDVYVATCRSKRLTSIPDCLPETLTYIDLYDNNITLTSSTFDKLPNLEIVFLDNNGLVSVPEDAFSKLVNLSYVSLNNNNLVTIPVNLFASNPNIFDIDVYNNYLQNLDFIFVESSLQRVFASFNNIGSINSSVPINENIKILDIEANNLRTIEKQLFANTRNATLYLALNPWHCDCGLTPDLMDVFDAQDIIFYDGPICETPSELYGTQLSDVYYMCDYLNTTMKTA